MASPRIGKILTTVLGPKVGLPLMMSAALLSAPFLYRNHQLAGLPDIGDPFDVEAFYEIDISDKENAYIEYRQALAMLIEMPESDDDEFYEAMEKGWATAPLEIKHWVDDNRAAMKVWREGTEKPDALYINPADIEFGTAENVKGFRNFVRLANLEGSRLEAEGKPEEAWQWYRAAFRSSRHTGRYGTIIDRMTGWVLHSIATDAMIQWADNPDVDKALLQQAFAEITADYTMTESIATTLKVKYLYLQNNMRENFSFARSEVEMFIKNEPELSRRVNQHRLAEELAQHHKSVAVPQTQQHLPPAELDRYVKRSLIGALFNHVTPLITNQATREQARQAALEMIFAAQIYFRDQGRFPETAEQLLGNDLKSIPVDPFSPSGEPMQYRFDQTTGGVVIWSIGDNGIDDGGDIEPNDHHRTLDHGFRIHPPAEVGSP